MSHVTSRHIDIISQINRRRHRYGTDVCRLRYLNFNIYVCVTNQLYIHMTNEHGLVIINHVLSEESQYLSANDMRENENILLGKFILSLSINIYK